ncbi:MAG: GGDEF domain-containing response regulator [Nitrospiraceae bacterium]|nr:MAG: GGDEF domain-containing response regulator [Nitrospiraceae bacterium]
MADKKILVAEDESIVGLHIADSLRKLGYAVPAVVASGEEAVRKSGELRPDLILMDIVLKGDMDGIEAAGLIRSRFNIPVIYLTAYGDDETLRRAKITEPLGYILKPFKERELHTAIEIALYRHEMETKLKKMERWLATTLRSIGDAVIAADENINITFMNKTAEDMTGWKQEDAIGKKLTEVFNIKGEETRTVEWVLANKVLKEGVIINLAEDSLLITRDSKEIPISDSAAPIKEEHGIPGIVIVFRDITDRKQLEEALIFRDCHDSLTGLPNRGLFIDRLSLKIADAHRNNRQLAVLFLDLDRFKRINDTLGHFVGDMLLKKVSEKIRTCIRESDTIARIGGDEFSILLPDIGNAVDAGVSAEKILATFETPYRINGHELNISTSIGISMYPDDGLHFEELMKNADIAMYQAKEKGRNNYQFYDPAVNVRTLELIALENMLRQAIKRDELLVYYQPLADISMQRVIGAEALVRWRHPELGLLDPMRFLPLAEETGFIKSIDSFVLRTACGQNRTWQQAGLSPISVSVNFSAMQFQRPDLEEMVTQVLSESSLGPEYLCVEITENVAMRDIEMTLPNVTRLKGLGIGLSIDDFGTGYSSLSCLRKFPIKKLKIDKSFVRDIADPDNKAIIGAIIAMAHNLKLKTLAEGVEDMEQIEFLRSLGCDEIQGYLFSRPLPADEFKEMMTRA